MVHNGDVLEVLRRESDGSFDACLTDPPYGLGFMGKQWDAGVPGADVWAEVLRCLKPGAMMLAFGGTRTFHRVTCAIEDAGFEIRDCLMWLYGSGFPKSHDISKALDKQAGVTREVIEMRKSAGGRSTADRDAGKTNKFDPITARLILPPRRETARRLLVPFCGSGSEMIGARRAGWEDVAGIEIDPEYAAICRRRLEAASWRSKKNGFTWSAA